MPVKSGVSHWGSLAKFFHWTTVVLILVQQRVTRRRAVAEPDAIAEIDAPLEGDVETVGA